MRPPVRAVSWHPACTAESPAFGRRGTTPLGMSLVAMSGQLVEALIAKARGTSFLEALFGAILGFVPLRIFCPPLPPPHER